ncbi:hypothetical protein BGW42_004999 [Actinomortierella wolfii]|nr:hypothetical protein BGW42_004999 [Actinomortierella wolfii]
MTNQVSETSPLLQQSAGSPSTEAGVITSDNAAERRKQEARGLVYMTLSALFFSSMSLLVSIAAKTLPSFELVLFRGIIQTLLGLAACWYLGISPLGDPGVRMLVFWRGLSGSVALALFFYSLSVMPLADATVVFFLGPTFTAILARLVLKEPYTPLDALAGLLTMTGVVLVVKPTALFPSNPTEGELLSQAFVLVKQNRLYGTIAGVCGATCTATAYCIVRKLGKRAHSMVHVVYFGAVSCVVSVVGLFTMQGGYVAPKTSLMWGGVLCLGFFSFIGQILLNNGLQLAPVGPGTLMRMNDIVFAFIFQITVQHEHPDLLSYVGATMVIFCTAGMSVYRWWRDKKRAERERRNTES